VCQCLDRLVLGNSRDGVEQPDELRAALLAAQDVVVLERQPARSAKTTRNGSNSAIDAVPIRWPAGRIWSGSAILITESTPATAAPVRTGTAATARTASGGGMSLQERIGGKSWVGTRVDDRDRTAAPRDSALYTLIWREEHGRREYARYPHDNTRD
jgi:hypothetical protein